MALHGGRLPLSTPGDGAIVDLTEGVRSVLRRSRVANGVAVVVAVDSTVAATTMEHEPGGVADRVGPVVAASWRPDAPHPRRARYPSASGRVRARRRSLRARESALYSRVRSRADPARVRRLRRNPLPDWARRSLKTQQHAHLDRYLAIRCASRFDRPASASVPAARIDPSRPWRPCTGATSQVSTNSL